MNCGFESCHSRYGCTQISLTPDGAKCANCRGKHAALVDLDESRMCVDRFWAPIKES